MKFQINDFVHVNGTSGVGTPRKTALKAKEQRIAELEAEVNMYKQSLKTQTAYVAGLEKRIAELEANKKWLHNFLQQR